MAVGAALGLSGAIFQSMTRNPPASPDVLGINTGAAMVAAWLIIAGVPPDLLRPGSFVGAMAVIVLLGVLGVRRHFSLQRLLLVGIAVNAFLRGISRLSADEAAARRSAPSARRMVVRLAPRGLRGPRLVRWPSRSWCSRRLP
ncbi:MAG: iron chelate uptake ABC transporter family permease subunit [Gammaproteobacteria bacterium]